MDSFWLLLKVGSAKKIVEKCKSGHSRENLGSGVVSESGVFFCFFYFPDFFFFLLPAHGQILHCQSINDE